MPDTRTADVQGAVIGKKVARWLDKHYFQPTKQRPRTRAVLELCVTVGELAHRQR